MTISFFIIGEPCGTPRPRITVRGRFAHAYTPKTTKRADGSKAPVSIWAWKDAIVKYSARYRPGKPLAGPVRVDVTFYFPRPNSHYGTGRNAGTLKPGAPKYHIAKPDIDNILKAKLDSLTEAGFWNDDAQVAGGTLLKVYGAMKFKSGKEFHGAWVTITELDDKHDGRLFE